MKIIHCADVHLDSPMTSNLDREKAAERNNELMGTFSDMADYAVREGVRAVIIAGDLFDRNRVSASVKNIVYGVMSSHPELIFFYLRGNHDTEESGSLPQNIPSNLKMFGKQWTSYLLRSGLGGNGRVTVTGIEARKNEPIDYADLSTDPGSINIVVLHGLLSEYGSWTRPEEIDLKKLEGRSIDYLALGHLHQYRTGTLAPRGKYCYPGCLEGRGFDEKGEHGFVLLDIDTQTGRIEDQFIPFAKRRLFELRVDITGCMTTAEIMECMWEALRNSACRQTDMVKFVLDGEVDVECEKNTDYLEQQFCEMFYFVRIADQSRLTVDYHDYERDVSLKGEFIRLVQAAEDLTEQEKAETIRCGLQALNEEDISL